MMIMPCYTTESRFFRIYVRVYVCYPGVISKLVVVEILVAVVIAFLVAGGRICGHGGGRGGAWSL